MNQKTNCSNHKPFWNDSSRCFRCGESFPSILQSEEDKRRTELNYNLGGASDPHFQDHGGNQVPDRAQANEWNWKAERDRDLEYESQKDWASIYEPEHDDQ